MRILENDEQRVISLPEYNYVFNKKSGLFMRWGETKDDDPDYSPVGPEIADIEITDICYGIRCDETEKSRKVCKFCYKSNSPSHTGNMTFEQFKTVFDKLCVRKINNKSVNWPVLTQIAFGADAQAKANPDLWKMMDYCRNNDHNYVVPNITVADIDDEIADKLVKYCGAVAVSYYPDQNKDCCYDSVKKLTDRGLVQTNIHVMVSSESYDDVLQLLKDRKTDQRLEKVNAIVMLSLKQKGRGVSFTKLSDDKFKKIVDYAFENNIGIGFDSCSAPKFLNSVRDRKDFKKYLQLAEPCESVLFSTYINCHGEFFPCSFMEGEKNWETGISVLECDDFLKDVWYHERTKQFRKKLIKTSKNSDINCRSCPHYDV